MMRTVTVVRQYLVVTFLLLIGLAAYGCGDSATVNPVVELSSLTVNPGTLQPAFSGETTQYSVNLSNDVTTVTVTAQPAVGGDTITINGQTTTSRAITLDPPGSTTIVNVVVSETGTNSRTYVVRLVRAGLAGNNSLENLAVTPGTLAPTFNMNQLTYTLTVPNTAGSVNVTPALSDPAATMTVNGQAAISGQPSTVTLNPAGQSTTVTILVTSQNGTEKPYTITVSRGVSNNNNLQSLTISPGTLSPAFNAATVGYTVNVASGVANITVTPREQDTAATITVNGQATNSGQARSITLNGAGSNTFINIVVTAENGTQKTYSINVIRAALGGNNNLSGLTVSPGSLDPGFSANTTNYTVDVANGVTSVTVTPREQDTAATTTVNGQATNSGQARTIQLNGAGSNTSINVMVTAPNGNQKSYSITVERAALGGNNNLSGLSVSPGSLDPNFSANTTNYTVDVGSGVSSISVTPTRQDSNATITVNGTPATSGQGRSVTLNGAGSNTSINIGVTAPNGNQKSYSITVERAALGGNNNLSGLSVSPGSLDPNFSANTTNYTVDVGSGVSSVSVTPSEQDTAATTTVNGQATNSGQARTIQLNGAGSNTVINIVVTAPNGSQRTYSVTVSRAALGGNNNLQSLTVSPGALSPSFTSGRTAYAVNNVGSSATSILVTATPQDSSATVTINTQGGNSRSIPLPGGPSSTEIEVGVIAPNGNDRTYLITVNQPAPAEPPAPTSAPDLIAEDDSCLLVGNVCFPPTSDVDNITNVTTPRFRISQPGAGETADLYVDGNKVSSAFDSGGNTLRPTSALSDGNHSITSTVTNGGGESSQSPSLTVNINSVAPGGP